MSYTTSKNQLVECQKCHNLRHPDNMYDVDDKGRDLQSFNRALANVNVSRNYHPDKVKGWKPVARFCRGCVTEVYLSEKAYQLYQVRAKIGIRQEIPVEKPRGYVYIRKILSEHEEK